MTLPLCYIVSSLMSLLKNRWRKRGCPGRSLLVAALCLIATACTTATSVEKVLFEDPRGTVFLQQIPDRSFKATHPINLEPALIARVLSGVLIKERQRVLQELLTGSSSPVPVFSAEEIQFLAPLLAKALATAAIDQAVGFTLTSQRPGASSLEYSAVEATTGSLYAYGASLGFSLSQYRSTPTRTGTEHIARRRLPDSSGLSERVLLFGQAQAQRTDDMLRPPPGVDSDKFLAIDYRLLQHVPPTAAKPEPPAAHPEHVTESVRKDAAPPLPAGTPSNSVKTKEQRDEEIQALKDLVVKKDLELETIRKELQSLRRQLDDRTTGQESRKRKQ
jgi:hypothetical protein